MLAPATEEELSHASLSFTGSGGVTLWSDPATRKDVSAPLTETRLSLSVERPIVVGRQDGGEVPYLDPAYRPTRVVPGLLRPVVDGTERDRYVSRGHFLLTAAAGGLVLINGVPGREGGVRTPLNGTRLVEPESRPMLAGEEYLIRHGEQAGIELPNGTRVLIRAE